MRKTACTMLALIVPLLLLVPTASATPPVPAVGAWAPVALTEIVDSRLAGVVAHVKILSFIGFTGIFDGTAVCDGNIVFNTRTGEGTIQQWCDFEGEVEGREGTALVDIKWRGTPAPFGFLEGRWVVIGGTDDLKNLHGQGTIEGVVLIGGTMEGQMHFDP